MLKLVVLSLLLALSLWLAGEIEQVNAVSCKTPDGADVSWYFVHKTRRTDTHYWGYHDATHNLTYTTYAAASGGYKAVKGTLDAVFDAAHYLVWNSEKDRAGKKAENKPKPADGAHEKGWIGWDNGTSAAFVLHTVPNWNSKANIPGGDTTTAKNGQAFMCITVPSANIPDILAGLHNAQIRVFRGCTGHASGLDNATALCNDKWGAADSFISKDLTIGGKSFKFFSKGPDVEGFRKDIWSAIAINLNACFTVSTWLKLQLGCASGKCSPLKNAVNDADTETVTVGVGNVITHSLGGGSHDHSKLGFVSEDSKSPWACVGGNNRNKKQFERGGLALCINDTILRNTMKAIFTVSAPRACDLTVPAFLERESVVYPGSRFAFRSRNGNGCNTPECRCDCDDDRPDNEGDVDTDDDAMEVEQPQGNVNRKRKLDNPMQPDATKKDKPLKD